VRLGIVGRDEAQRDVEARLVRLGHRLRILHLDRRGAVNRRIDERQVTDIRVLRGLIGVQLMDVPLLVDRKPEFRRNTLWNAAHTELAVLMFEHSVVCNTSADADCAVTGVPAGVNQAARNRHGLLWANRRKYRVAGDGNEVVLFERVSLAQCSVSLRRLSPEFRRDGGSESAVRDPNHDGLLVLPYDNRKGRLAVHIRHLKTRLHVRHRFERRIRNLLARFRFHREVQRNCGLLRACGACRGNEDSGA